jgi:hypothetical protein
VGKCQEMFRSAQAIQYEDIVLWLKACDTKEIISANRLVYSTLDKSGRHCPIHLGVTESGSGDSARIKSAAGRECILVDGIGDTIRVLLTEDPIKEIELTKNMLQDCDIRNHNVKSIECPSCARTSDHIQSVLEKLKILLGRLLSAKIWRLVAWDAWWLDQEKREVLILQSFQIQIGTIRGWRNTKCVWHKNPWDFSKSIGSPFS